MLNRMKKKLCATCKYESVCLRDTTMLWTCKFHAKSVHTCEICGKILEKTWSDKDPKMLVCYDCYERILFTKDLFDLQRETSQVGLMGI